MIANHIHHALAQVRELQQRVLESQRFRGYSGRARAMGGTAALIGAVILSRGVYPGTDRAHLYGWAVVWLLGVSFNYGALLCWFLSEPGDKRDLRQLLPAVDQVFPLLVGGILTLSMVLGGQYPYLFGIWMCLYGLANLSARWVMPRAVIPLGLYYIAAGALCLLVPGLSFTNPWPMGLVFFTGELIGGFIFFFNRNPAASLRAFFGF